MSYKAKFSCPGCGSPLVMAEGTISLRCSYCNLVMRVGTPGRILKYLYPSRLEQSSLKFIIEHFLKESGNVQNLRLLRHKLYFLPFYRFKGMTYALISEKKIEQEPEEVSEMPPLSRIVYHQRCRHFDLTIPAFTEKAFGLESLGIRPKVIPLDFFLKGNIPNEASLVDLKVAPEEARQIALGMFAFNLGFALEGKECRATEMIGEGLSVIYHPVWGSTVSLRNGITTFFIDGVSKKVFSQFPGEFEYESQGIDFSRAADFRPIAHKCPNCGFDLPTSENSLIYYCLNCYRLFIIDGDEYRNLQVSYAVYEKSETSAPFWRFPFSIGEELSDVAGYSKILTGEIPLIARDKAKNKFYLYAPAFKLPDLDTLTARGLRLCRTQPILRFLKDGFKPGAEAILPESEGLELARFYWEVMRSRYRQLYRVLYDFKNDYIGRGELVWLTMSESALGGVTSVKGKTSSYA